MSEPTDLLGTVEAASRIGVERSTLTRWVSSGRIASALKLPGQNGTVLFTRSEVERVATEYAAEKAARAAAASA